MRVCVDFNNQESHNITVTKIQHPLSCKERCKYPGMPCGLKERIGHSPCTEVILDLRVSVAKRLRKIKGFSNISILDVKTIGPHSCSSHPPRATRYHTDLVVEKDGVEIPLGFIENGIYQSE